MSRCSEKTAKELVQQLLLSHPELNRLLENNKVGGNKKRQVGGVGWFKKLILILALGASSLTTSETTRVNEVLECVNLPTSAYSRYPSIPPMHNLEAVQPYNMFIDNKESLIYSKLNEIITDDTITTSEELERQIRDFLRGKNPDKAFSDFYNQIFTDVKQCAIIDIEQTKRIFEELTRSSSITTQDFKNMIYITQLIYTYNNSPHAEPVLYDESNKYFFHISFVLLWSIYFSILYVNNKTKKDFGEYFDSEIKKRNFLSYANYLKEHGFEMNPSIDTKHIEEVQKETFDYEPLKEQVKHINALTGETLWGVQQYTMSYCLLINKYSQLYYNDVQPRNDIVSKFFNLTGKIIINYNTTVDIIRNIDQVFKDIPAIETPITVYRGFTTGIFVDSNQEDLAKQFKYYQYLSTTLSTQVAKSYAFASNTEEFRNPNSLVVEIRIPQGAKILPVEGITLAKDHHEIILDRRGKLAFSEEVSPHAHFVFNYVPPDYTDHELSLVKDTSTLWEDLIKITTGVVKKGGKRKTKHRKRKTKRNRKSIRKKRE